MVFFVFSIPALAEEVKSPIDRASGVLGNAVAPTGIPTDDVQNVTGKIIKGALTAVGSVFFLLMVYGGYVWMTARGEEDKVTEAKDLIKAAMIGLAITVGAYAVTVFIVGRLT